MSEPGYAPKTMVSSPDTYRHVLQYLIHKRFYVVNADGTISTPKNIHPVFLYYMFFYSVDPEDFHLLHFSDPFMIEHPISSYLDFPVGLTQFGDDMLLSYGHGDCASYLAKFPKDVYDGLLTHTNATPLEDIQYHIYGPEMGEVSYGVIASVAALGGGKSRKRSKRKRKHKTRKR